MPLDVIMPALGMAQDTGLIVVWHKNPGDAVSEGDILFEVETDKATMEVEAQGTGFLSDVAFQAGEDVPVGQTIAVISDTSPAKPATVSAPPPPQPTARQSAPLPPPAPQAKTDKPATELRPVSQTSGRILASPKLRRLALEQGLDLGRLVELGHPQPYHVKDLETLKALPITGAQSDATTASRLTAELATDGFAEFANWAAQAVDQTDSSALLAGFGAASFGNSAVVTVAAFGMVKTYTATRQLGLATLTEDAADLCIRDLRFASITSVHLGAEDIPTLTLTRSGDGLSITLEYGTGQLTAPAAIELLSNFAGRMEQPLRHLL
ncbi:biotin/lipoyl-containing protein [Phaeobacter sp. C3_T13_0]|uniref:biotin/lipoyl-containing protein n=1 Tax=Phaeobacter cretensis TaxID=3342641 RepID=UPI0039BCC600